MINTQREREREIEGGKQRKIDRDNEANRKRVREREREEDIEGGKQRKR